MLGLKSYARRRMIDAGQPWPTPVLIQAPRLPNTADDNDHCLRQDEDDPGRRSGRDHQCGPPSIENSIGSWNPANRPIWSSGIALHKTFPYHFGVNLVDKVIRKVFGLTYVYHLDCFYCFHNWAAGIGYGYSTVKAILSSRGSPSFKRLLDC